MNKRFCVIDIRENFKNYNKQKLQKLIINKKQKIM